MSASGPPAQVTGISPIEGVPGTKLTLRGEHFGQSALDLTHVFVGGIDVSPSARWFSPRKLSVITPLGTGELEIVVVTRSGGIGTSELTYTQNVGQKIGMRSFYCCFIRHLSKLRLLFKLGMLWTVLVCNLFSLIWIYRDFYLFIEITFLASYRIY